MFTLNNGTFIYSHDSAIEAIRDLGLSIEDTCEDFMKRRVCES